MNTQLQLGMTVLEGDSILPLTDIPHHHNYATREITDLAQLQGPVPDGSYLYVSQTRGLWLVTPRKDGD